MKKIFVSVITFFLLFLMQTGIFHMLAVDGVVPNLVLILVCAYGFLRGETEGVIAGFLCGLAVDVVYSPFIGFNSLVLMYIGFFNGCLNRLYIEDRVKLPIICIGFSDLLFSLVTYGLRFMLNGHFNFLFYFRKIIMPEFIYTLGVCIIVYPLIMVIEKRIVEEPLIKEKEDAF